VGEKNPKEKERRFGMIWIYLLIGFVIFFFTWKKLKDEFQLKLQDRPCPVKEYRTISALPWVETKEFWILLLLPTLWPIVIPILIMWRLLDLIYNKFIN
tara:strand:- start:121 stop:417 length:297 start_codon:yes stop_codon:yes gene_type:complete